MIERIESLLVKYELSHAEFADKLNLSRSNISHIFSRRNKPSLDFILKIHKCFPNEDLCWLLTGSQQKEPKNNKTEEKKNLPLPTLPKRLDYSESFIKDSKIKKEEKTIERIVFFYEDGSFKSFQCD